ncbi:MAG: prepilin peptidase [bacterium]|nr:prepilin peptidase [bacterium]
MLFVIFGLFGLIIGSFINVVVLRSGARALSGRSGCMSCGKEIPWFDLIPVFSWLQLRGRCRACGSRISFQYPAVESTTGISFALVGGASLPPVATVLGLLICAVLIAIVVYDLLHTVIPDAWVWSFNALAFVSIFLSPLQATSYWLPAVLAGPAVALPLFVLWLVSRGRWIGLGDSKLALGIGWLLGPLYGIQAVLLAFIIGAVVSVCVLLPLPHLIRFFKKAACLCLPARCTQAGGARRQGIAQFSHTASYTMKSEVPFGPFLVVACFLVWVSQMYGIQIPFLWQ